MLIIPRTPISPRRLKPITMVSSPSASPTRSAFSISPSPEKNTKKDVYDKFINIYFNTDLKVQNVLLRKIFDFVGHPVYVHILKTMDKDNAHHVMGYLRSQRSAEMYIILDQIIQNPLPTKEDFYSSIKSL
jgi:hypothetical protein